MRKAPRCARGYHARRRSSPSPPERRGKGILVDTSVWIDHFRHSDADLRKVIADDRLPCHPVVIGELALGSLRDRGGRHGILFGAARGTCR